MITDREFIAGNFFEADIPLEKKYLFKYFTSEIQVQFVKYYLSFSDHENFMDHTGTYCTMTWVKKMRNTIDRLMARHARAKKDFDFKTLRDIEDGKFILKGNI